MEQLEGRDLLAASTANVFAQFQGEITQPFEKQSVEIFLIPGNFQLGFGPANVGFLARPVDNSQLAPVPVKIESLNPFNRGMAMPILESRPGLPDGGSIALAHLKRGAYKVEVGGSGETIGKWQLDVFLAGDVNGDFRVSNSDIAALETALSERNASPELLAVGDSNRDGIITISDLRVAQGNLGAATPIRPLTVTAQLTAASDTGIAGDNRVGTPEVEIVGLALPKAHVSLDVDGDGFDDGHAVVKSHSEEASFELDARLRPGVNTIRVMTSDNFGQIAFSELVVTLDATRPTVVSTSPEEGETIQAEFDSNIPVEIVFSEPMIASTVLEALTVSGNRTDSITPIAPTYDPETKTLRFEVDTTLADTVVTVTVDGAAMDEAGNRLAVHELEFRRRLASSIFLTEGSFFTRFGELPVHLGQSAGRQILSFDIAVLFDTSDQAGKVEDRLNVYLVDQASPWISLVDGVPFGVPVFSISPDGAEYLSDLVSFDGATVEIDVSSLDVATLGQLQFELLGSDSDKGSRARIAMEVRVESQ
jgi:hypothetical protein